MLRFTVAVSDGLTVAVKTSLFDFVGVTIPDSDRKREIEFLAVTDCTDVRLGTMDSVFDRVMELVNESRKEPDVL